VRREISGSPNDGVELGQQLGRELLAGGAREILDDLRKAEN